MKEFTLKLEANDVNDILGALGKIPLEASLGTFMKVRTQVDEQNKPELVKDDDKKKVS